MTCQPDIENGARALQGDHGRTSRPRSVRSARRRRSWLQHGFVEASAPRCQTPRRDADRLPCARHPAARLRRSGGREADHSSGDKLLLPSAQSLAVERATADRGYHLHKGSVTRPHSSVTSAAIHHGEHWDRQQLSWSDQWEKLTAHSGQRQAITFLLSESFDQQAFDRGVVLAIARASLALLRGIDWFCCVVRRHAGRRRDGLRFAFRYPHAKRVSPARFSDFALDVQWIVVGLPLRGYALERNGDDCALIITRPTLFTGRADKLRGPPAAIETSGVADIGISRTSTSLLPGQASQPVWSRPESGSCRNCEPESSFVTVEQSSSGRRPPHNAAHHWGRAP
jgi:hypothetical protein